MTKKKAMIQTIDDMFANYSPKLKKKLISLAIVPGDRIKLSHKSRVMEGNLLEQNELGNPNSLLIKLDNGYNIGLKWTPSSVIEKLDGKVELESFQIRVPEQKSDLPQIALLATGGTIASRIDYQTGGVVMAMQPEEIFASLPELFEEVSFKSVKSLFSMGSEDMNHIQWQKIAQESFNELNDGSRGIVISHGTDIMGYTAAALSFMLPQLNAPVVITGAQRSSDRGSYDGAINLISASRVAANSNIASVMICMHETSEDASCLLLKGTKVRKMHTSRRDAFRPINAQPLARIDINGKITEIDKSLPRRHTNPIELKDQYNDNVTLIKLFPGMKPELLDWYIDQQIEGIILEGTGLGHVPTFTPAEEKRSWMPALQRARDEGIYVGMTSQCLYGRVHAYVYKALRTGFQAGINYLGDMLPETAIIKLGWTLGNYTDQIDITKIMSTNLVGELNELIRYQEFLN